MRLSKKKSKILKTTILRLQDVRGYTPPLTVTPTHSQYLLEGGGSWVLLQRSPNFAHPQP